MNFQMRFYYFNGQDEWMKSTRKTNHRLGYIDFCHFADSAYNIWCILTTTTEKPVNHQKSASTFDAFSSIWKEVTFILPDP